jgi:hypothetical protein
LCRVDQIAHRSSDHLSLANNTPWMTAEETEMAQYRLVLSAGGHDEGKVRCHQETTRCENGRHHAEIRLYHPERAIHIWRSQISSQGSVHVGRGEAFDHR